MRRKAVIVDWYKPELHLYAVGDTHVGSEACDEAALRRVAQIIADDDCALAVGLGDYIEAVAYDDRRFDPREMAQFVGPENLNNIFCCQAAYFAELFKETAGKWAMLIAGNHETTAATRYHTDATALIAERLGTKYQGQMDESGWLLIRLLERQEEGKRGKSRGILRVYCQHGWGGGELRGGDALKLERLCYRKQADVVLLAHTHRAHTFPVTVEGVNDRGWETKQERWGVIAYPMVEKHGYIARKGGNAPPVGYAMVRVQRVHEGAPKVGVQLQAV